MKKLFLLIVCCAACVSTFAQDKQVAISAATASCAEPKFDAANAIDGNTSTYWHSPWSESATRFPVTFTITLEEATHVDYVRYIPRQDGNTNGNWESIYVAYCSTTTGTEFTSLGNYNLYGSSSKADIWLTEEGVTCGQIRFTIESGDGRFASAAEIEAYTVDNSYKDQFAQYFTDAIFSKLKPEVKTSEGIEDPTLKLLVDSLLADSASYCKFRVGEYEPYLTTGTLINMLKVSSYYNNYENPTGVYLKKGESCLVAVSGINTQYPVGLTIKNWVENENSSSYTLRNGLNQITATTEGNVFVNYYTDDHEIAPNVKVHFINAPVQGYWDQATMTNEDWIKLLEGRSEDDNTILITRSEHAQLAYPVSAWLAYCPTNVDSTMTLYQQVQWAQRDLLGLEKYGRQFKNRQLYYATTYGFMAAGGEGAYCNVNSLGAIMYPDSKKFDFWGVGHEWGHNNQITTGFKWSGCGETTNNIYASWGQIHFTGTPHYLRLEDETSGIDEYSGMRGGRMQTYFEEALRKGVAWQLQDGPDYHGATPESKNVSGQDANGKNIGTVTTTSRNYDHFVKLVPFWQLNLWGTLAGKCPDIIPMVIESIRSTKNYTSYHGTNGKKQINWMKLACDSAQIDLLPFFEKAGMLRPIHAYIEDYQPGWNIITEEMIAELKAYVKEKGYPAYTEEINYINGHNYHIYRDCLKLEVPKEINTGCKLSNNKVTVQHNDVKNAVAFETYNFKGELLRITMYGLGSNDSHSYTQVLYPKNNNRDLNAAYIMAVGYDGTRMKIYESASIEEIYKEAFNELFEQAKNYLTQTDTTGTMIGYLLPDSIESFSILVSEMDSIVKNTEESKHDYVKWYQQMRTAIELLQSNTSAYVQLVSNCFYTLSASSNPILHIDYAKAGLRTTKMEEEIIPQSLQWRFIEGTQEGTYYLQHRESRTYISYVADGKRVKAEANNMSEATLFTLVAKSPGAFFIQCVNDENIRLYNYTQSNHIYAGNQTGSNALWTIKLEDNMLESPQVSTEEEIVIYNLMRTDNGEYAYSYRPNSPRENGRIATAECNDTENLNFWFYFKQGSQENKYTMYNYATGKAITIDSNKLYINKDSEDIPEFTIALNEQGTGLSISLDESYWSMKRGNATELIELGTNDERTDWKLLRTRTISLINEPLTSLTIDKTQAMLLEGDSIVLTVETAPVYAANHSVTWSSSDESVASVDSTGKVKAIAAGVATITATANDNSGLTATCKVTVQKNESGIFSVSTQALSVQVLEGEIIVNGLPQNTTVKVYDTVGKQVATVVATNGKAIIGVRHINDIMVIVTTGSSSAKVLLK